MADLSGSGGPVCPSPETAETLRWSAVWERHTASAAALRRRLVDKIEKDRRCWTIKEGIRWHTMCILHFSVMNEDIFKKDFTVLVCMKILICGISQLLSGWMSLSHQKQTWDTWGTDERCVCVSHLWHPVEGGWVCCFCRGHVVSVQPELPEHPPERRDYGLYRTPPTELLQTLQTYLIHTHNYIILSHKDKQMLRLYFAPQSTYPG